MPGASDNYSMSIPTSTSAPTDLTSYSRFMHDHTKRQMEAQGAYSAEHTASASSTRGRSSTTSGRSSMTNGTSPDA